MGGNILNLLILINYMEIMVLALPIISANDSSLEDPDIKQGKLNRKEEFEGLPVTEYRRRNIELREHYRYIDWSIDQECRYRSGDLHHTHCYDPSAQPKYCFGARLDYKYTEQNGTFGDFPHPLRFLRHFPRCWQQLAPLVCLGHFRPCTFARKNQQDNHLYVLLQQFSSKPCWNMLDNCAFVSTFLFQHFPSYLNCAAHFRGIDTKQPDNEQILYKPDCKVNHLSNYTTLHNLANNSYQCLWPLVKATSVQALPLIDNCYLPCQSPLYQHYILHNFHLFSALCYFLMFLVTLSLLSLYFSTIKKQQLPMPLRATFLLMLFFATFDAFQRTLPHFNQDLFGQFATCYDGGDGLIRRYPDGFRSPESRENGKCILQAVLLSFPRLFIGWSLIIIILKILLESKILQKPNATAWQTTATIAIPKWSSNLLPIFPFLHSMGYILFNALTDQISVDPINGVCHFKMKALFTLWIIFYPFITISLLIFMAYLNWIVQNCHWKRAIAKRNRIPNISGIVDESHHLESNNIRIKRNADCNQILIEEGTTKERQNQTEISMQNGDIGKKREHKNGEERQETANPNDELALLRNDNEEGDNGTHEARKKRPNFVHLLDSSFWRWMRRVRRSLGRMLVIWAFLLFLCMFCGQLIISSEQEVQLVMKSINCSINRAMAEKASLEWIDRDEYKNNMETNPYFRKQQLGRYISDPYCQLELQSLHWHWLETILNCLELLLAAISVFALANFTEYLQVEKEIDERAFAMKMEVEMQEMRNRKRHGRGGRRRHHSYESAAEHSSTEYAKISSNSSVDSTLLPQSTLPPIPTTLPIPLAGAVPATAHMANTNIGNNSRQKKEEANNNLGNAKFVYGSEDANSSFIPYGSTEDKEQPQNYLNYSPSDMSSAYGCGSFYSLPPILLQNHRPHSTCCCQHAATNQFVAQQHQQVAVSMIADWMQRNCGTRATTRSNGNCVQNDSTKCRRRIGSDPAPVGSKQLQEKNSSKRRKLRIKGAPKEQQRVWRREDRQRRPSGAANADGERQWLTNTAGGQELVDHLYAQKCRPKNAQQQPMTPASSMEVLYKAIFGTPPTAPMNAEEISPMPMECAAANCPSCLNNVAGHQLYSCSFAQQQVLSLLMSAITSQQGGAVQFPGWQLPFPIPDEIAAQMPSCNFNQMGQQENDFTNDEEELEGNGNMNEREPVEEEEGSSSSEEYEYEADNGERERPGTASPEPLSPPRPETTSPERYSSSIPSSSCEEEEEDRDSNDFSSDSPDPEEERLWEERMKNNTSTVSAATGP